AGPCRTTTVGPCTITECSSFGTVHVDDAGALTIAGGLSTLMFAYDSPTTGYRETTTTTSPPWPPGSPLTMNATGATVPAFTASVVMPPQLTITAPAAPTTGATLTVSRAGALTFTWDAAATTIQLTFDTPGVTPFAAVQCTFDGAAGRGTVPA